MTTQTSAISFRIRDTRTGLVRRVLGTSLSGGQVPRTIVWVQREGDRGALPWSADELMSTWHDLEAVNERGRTQAQELAAAGGCEQDRATRSA